MPEGLSSVPKYSGRNAHLYTLPESKPLNQLRDQRAAMKCCAAFWGQQFNQQTQSKNK